LDNQTKKVKVIFAPYTILATGGCGAITGQEPELSTWNTSSSIPPLFFTGMQMAF
jgi:succinate dehydrogenase/fumarate reductase flavoprotein subunit